VGEALRAERPAEYVFHIVSNSEQQACSSRVAAKMPGAPSARLPLLGAMLALVAGIHRFVCHSAVLFANVPGCRAAAGHVWLTVSKAGAPLTLLQIQRHTQRR
jgi:hypothetical protein